MLDIAVNTLTSTNQVINILNSANPQPKSRAILSTKSGLYKLRTNLHTPNSTQTSRRLGEKPRQKTNKCWINCCNFYMFIPQANLP